MRETTRSLSMYFGLIGLFTSFVGGAAVLGCLVDLKANPEDLILLVVVSLFFLLGLSYLYIGVRLKKLLAESPQVPLRFAALGIFLSVLTVNIISILLNVYIFYQLKRMATEAVQITEDRTLS